MTLVLTLIAFLSGAWLAWAFAHGRRWCLREWGPAAERRALTVGLAARPWSLRRQWPSPLSWGVVRDEQLRVREGVTGAERKRANRALAGNPHFRIWYAYVGAWGVSLALGQRR